MQNEHGVEETVHVAYNVTPNNGNVVLWVTYLVPGTPPTTALRTDQPQPLAADCDQEDDEDDDD